MKTSSAKAKGRRLQQHIRDELRKWGGIDGPLKASYSARGEAMMPLEDDDITCTTMGESGVDIKLSPYAQRYIPFDIECKNTETASPWAWMEQAQANTKPDRIPLVVFKRNHSDVYCMLKFDDLLKVVK